MVNANDPQNRQSNGSAGSGPVQAGDEIAPAAALGYQLRKGLDRLGFEADKLMRANRVRQEAGRIAEQADEKTLDLGRRVIALADSGAPLNPELQTLISEVKSLLALAERKKLEVEAINAEAWVAPEPPAPGPPAQGQGPSQALPTPAEQPRISPVAPTPAGADALRVCPVCHEQARPQAAFCANCGYKLEA